MIDIKLDENWQLTSAATGDAPVTDEEEGLLQTIQIEALTQKGELFYDEEFGWSLLDFIQAEEKELVRIEIENRIRKKLSQYEEIAADSIMIEQKWSDDVLKLYIRFHITNGKEQSMNISLDRVRVEVTE